MSTLATVEQVMRQTQTPMSVRDIVETAGDALPTRSKTPDTVVARDLSMDIKRLGDESRFVRTAPGRYTLREFVSCGLIQMGDTGRLPASAMADAVAAQSAIAQTRVAQSAAAPAGQETTPVLSSALSGDRQPVLPASKSQTREEGTSRRAPTQEDATTSI